MKYDCYCSVNISFRNLKVNAKSENDALLNVRKKLQETLMNDFELIGIHVKRKSSSFMEIDD
jgi:hypothetical protein